MQLETPQLTINYMNIAVLVLKHVSFGILSIDLWHLANKEHE